MNYSSYPNAGQYYIEDRQVSYTEFQEYMRTHTRVGREQREQYTEHLTQMYMDEYLNAEEFNDRHTKAVNAVTESDLYTLVMDLPPLPDKPKPQPPVLQVPSQQPVAIPKQRRTLRREYKIATAWTLSLLVTAGTVIPLDVNAAQVYHGLGNSPAGYVILTVFGVLWSCISLILSFCFWSD